MEIVPEAIFLHKDPQRLREMERDSETKLWMFPLSGRNEVHKQAQKKLLPINRKCYQTIINAPKPLITYICLKSKKKNVTSQEASKLLKLGCAFWKNTSLMLLLVPLASFSSYTFFSSFSFLRSADINILPKVSSCLVEEKKVSA